MARACGVPLLTVVSGFNLEASLISSPSNGHERIGRDVASSIYATRLFVRQNPCFVFAIDHRRRAPFPPTNGQHISHLLRRTNRLDRDGFVSTTSMSCTTKRIINRKSQHSGLYRKKTRTTPLGRFDTLLRHGVSSTCMSS